MAELLPAGHRVVILDNLCNAAPGGGRAGRAIGHGRPVLVTGDIRDAAALDALLAEHPIDAIMHFAGLKAVGESVAKPLAYYENNVGGAVRCSRRCGGTARGGWSSARRPPSTASRSASRSREERRSGPPTPTAAPSSSSSRSSRPVAADRELVAVSLRYFNPVGAHESGLIGEDPRGVPNNLLPFIAQAAVGLRDRLRVFGGD